MVVIIVLLVVVVLMILLVVVMVMVLSRIAQTHNHVPLEPTAPMAKSTLEMVHVNLAKLEHTVLPGQLHRAQPASPLLAATALQALMRQ